MARVDMDSLSKALENLHSADRLVRDTIQLLPQCGSLDLLNGPITEVQRKLNGITELTAALCDSKTDDAG